MVCARGQIHGQIVPKEVLFTNAKWCADFSNAPLFYLRFCCVSGWSVKYRFVPNFIPTQLSQGKFPRSNSLSSRAFLCRHVHARGVSLLGSIFVGQLQGCTHLYSPLSTLSVLSPRGVITRPSGSSHSRRSVMGSITHFCEEYSIAWKCVWISRVSDFGSMATTFSLRCRACGGYGMRIHSERTPNENLHTTKDGEIAHTTPQESIRLRR